MSKPARISGSMRPIAHEAFGEFEARHLLGRAGFGGTIDQLRTLLEWGPAKSVDHLLDVDSAMDHFAPPRFKTGIINQLSKTDREAFRRARQRGDENTVAKFRERRQAMQRLDRQQIKDMREWWLGHMIQSPYPLVEKMTLFWHGHFATSYRTIENSWHMFQQNVFFRRNAVGSFETLLQGIVRDPAMLRYLDNNRNVKRSPNENFAREIMELFALGSGYTERDIKEGARALTGYTFQGNNFIFRRGFHDADTKRIFGNSGNYDGEDFVRLILSRRQCARFIVRKLYRFFVNEIPEIREPGGPQAQKVLRQMATTMLRSRYHLKPVLRELFLSEHFYDAHNRGRQIKSPIELIVGTVRALGTPARNNRLLLASAGRMGQELFAPPSVKGWEGGRSWINTSTIFERQNVANYLVTGTIPGARRARNIQPMNASALLADLRLLGDEAANDAHRVVPYLCKKVLGEHAGERHERTVLSFFQTHNGRVDNETLVGALALLTASPEYQLA